MTHTFDELLNAASYFKANYHQLQHELKDQLFIRMQLHETIFLLAWSRPVSGSFRTVGILKQSLSSYSRDSRLPTKMLTIEGDSDRSETVPRK
jgi:hypothetical protein